MGIITKGPNRTIAADALDALLTRANRCAHLAKLAVFYLAKFGPRYTATKTGRFIQKHLRRPQSNSEWLRRRAYTPEQLALQRAHMFERSMLFSVIVPLYNTHIAYLRKMIESVQAQTYGNWELCLADGSDNKHARVAEVCREYAQSDSRILYKKLARNGGISGNTNECLKMAKGEYVAFLDHDDILSPAALFQMMQVVDEREPDLIYTDEARFLSPDPNSIFVIHFKPDFGIDNLRANNYLCHFTAYKRKLLDVVGPYRSQYDGSQDHDMMLRIAAVTNNIAHIPEVLYLWRAHSNSVALNLSAKSNAPAAGRKAVYDSLKAQGIEAEVENDQRISTIYHVRYKLKGTPRVSIVIPTCDNIRYLRKCLESIESLSTYDNYEIILVENNSRRDETFAYYREAQGRWPNVKVACWPGPWNWSAINNFGVRAATGEYYLLLNNDTQVITPGWIEEMLMFAQRSDVGIVGAKLCYANNTIQHAGTIVGLGGGTVGHIFHGFNREESGYANRLLYAQDLSAVTGACIMVRRNVWDQLGGADEELAVCCNDTDLCLRARKEGYLVVWTPHAELYHFESRSRGYDDTPRKIDRARKERELFWKRWEKDYGQGDPYYNPNLSMLHYDFRPKDTEEEALARHTP